MQDVVQQYLEYLKTVRNYKPSSLRKAKLHIEKLNKHLAWPLLDVKKSSTIEAACVMAATVRKIKNNGGHLDGGELMRFRLGISAAQFLRWAHGEGLIERNPYPKNTFRKPHPREAAYLTDEQLGVLLNQDSMSIADHALIRFMLDTAMRRDEVCRIKKADVDLVERVAHVRCGKNEGFRSVPFSEKTLFWLELYLSMRTPQKFLFTDMNVSGYLFPSINGEKLHPNMLNKKFGELSKAVGFRVSCHMLRHTAGRLWAEAGVNQSLIMIYLGHSDASMTRQYVHTNVKKLRELQEKVYAHSPVYAR